MYVKSARRGALYVVTEIRKLVVRGGRKRSIAVGYASAVPCELRRRAREASYGLSSDFVCGSQNHAVIVHGSRIKRNLALNERTRGRRRRSDSYNRRPGAAGNYNIV